MKRLCWCFDVAAYAQAARDAILAAGGHAWIVRQFDNDEDGAYFEVWTESDVETWRHYCAGVAYAVAFSLGDPSAVE